MEIVRLALHSCVLPAFASSWLGDRAMNFQSLLVGATLLVVSACASDPPAQSPVTSAAPPPEAVVVEQLPPPPDVVNAEKPAPRPKVTKLPDPKAPSKCKGLPQLACINVEECEWIKRTASTDRDGRPLLDYCGLKTATASTKE
jgi:outer membrane biosynthesis protein TonB